MCLPLIQQRKQEKKNQKQEFYCYIFFCEILIMFAVQGSVFWNILSIAVALLCGALVPV